jgi:hypothetical protein
MGNIENFTEKTKKGLNLWGFSTRDRDVCVAVEKLVAVKVIKGRRFAS